MVQGPQYTDLCSSNSSTAQQSSNSRRTPTAEEGGHSAIAMTTRCRPRVECLSHTNTILLPLRPIHIPYHGLLISTRGACCCAMALLVMLRLVAGWMQ